MIKKYYQSCNSLKYSFWMTGLAFLIFAEAFLMTNGKAVSQCRIAMIITAAVLAVIMLFYYRNKIRINSILKKVKNINAYEDGGMVDRTYLLEERMLVCKGLDIKEVFVSDVDQAELEELPHGKYVMHIHTAEGTADMSMMDKKDAQKVAKYLQKRNTSVTLKNVEPIGNGTLKEFGADVKY